MMTTTMTTAAKPNIPELMKRVSDRKLSFGSRLSTVGEVMRATQHQMLSALPKHVMPDRMIRVAMNCIRKTPKLLECSPVSLFSAITEAATYGWELGGVLGHAYLVPFRDECTLIPGYKGMIDLCRRSGQVSTISMEVVHQGDAFEYSLGDDPNIKHVPNPKAEGNKIVFVYAVVKLRDGGIQRSVWSAEKIDAHKERYSQGWKRAESGKKDSPWHTEWETMAKKTVILEMIKRGLVPLSAEFSNMLDRTRIEDELEMATEGIDLFPAGDISQLPRIEDDSQLDPLEEISEQFLSAETRADAAKVRDDFLGPDAVADLTDEQRGIVQKWFEDACKRIEPPKSKQKTMA